MASTAGEFSPDAERVSRCVSPASWSPFALASPRWAQIDETVAKPVVGHGKSRAMLFRMVSVALVGAVLALCALPAQAAISFVQALGTAQANSGSTLSITLGPAVTVPVGDTIIVSFAMNPRGAPGDVQCSDSGANLWHVDGDVTRGSAIDGVRAVTCSTRVTTALGTGDSITVSHPANADERGMTATEFSGLRANALDRAATGVGIDDPSPLTAMTAATTIGDELLVGTIGVEGPPVAPDTFTPGAGYLPLARAGTQGGGAAGNISVNGEYRIVNATGQYVANATLGVARDWAAILTTYRSACGNGVVDPR